MTTRKGLQSLSSVDFLDMMDKRDLSLSAAIRSFLSPLEPPGVYPDLKASPNLKLDLADREKSKKMAAGWQMLSHLCVLRSPFAYNCRVVEQPLYQRNGICRNRYQLAAIYRDVTRLFQTAIFCPAQPLLCGDRQGREQEARSQWPLCKFQQKLRNDLSKTVSRKQKLDGPHDCGVLVFPLQQSMRT